MKQMILTFALIFIIANNAKAEESTFILGDPTSGVKIEKAENQNLKIRFRIQPRIDLGDLRNDGTKYKSESDMYFRRIRAEFSGSAAKNLSYKLVLEGDKLGKDDTSNTADVYHAYIKYKFSDMLYIKYGSHDIPLSRLELVSSSRQLIIERTAVTGAAMKYFGKTHSQHQVAFFAGGKIAEGIVSYDFATGDGFEMDDEIYTGYDVITANPYYGGRIELALPGWEEKKKNDSHLSLGHHLVIGANYSEQRSIEYVDAATTTDFNEEDRSVVGYDISFAYGPIAFAAEKIEMKINSTDNARDTEPEGYYVQASYYVSPINVELAYRYDEYDHDSLVTHNDERTHTYAINWYLKGHSLKLMVNYLNVKYDKAIVETTDERDKDLVQIQGQLYF